MQHQGEETKIIVISLGGLFSQHFDFMAWTRSFTLENVQEQNRLFWPISCRRQADSDSSSSFKDENEILEKSRRQERFCD